jgi:hypothetical protein
MLNLEKILMKDELGIKICNQLKLVENEKNEVF